LRKEKTMRMSEPEAEPVSLGQAKIKRETAKALLVVLIDDDMKEQWVPKSCVDDNSDLFAGCVGQEELIVKAWWAEKEGLA
jgi:hypothetical protein